MAAAILVSELLQFDRQACAHILQRHPENDIFAVLLHADEVLESVAQGLTLGHGAQLQERARVFCHLLDFRAHSKRQGVP